MVKAKTSSAPSAPVAPASSSEVDSSSGLPAGLTLYTSNYMENLADLCALLMSEYPQQDPFVHEHVVVMNMGMRTYLMQRIALQNQIAALCDFHQIWQLIYRVFRIMHPDAPDRSLYDREHLTWNVYTLLCKHVVEPLKDFEAEAAAGEGAANASEGVQRHKGEIFFKLQQYLVDDQFGDKAYELAAKIADALDQYQMYRPQWIQVWNTLSLQAFSDYEVNPDDPSNPINVFIENICRDLVRRKSGLKQGTGAVAGAGQVRSLLQVEHGAEQGISAERVNFVRSLFKENVWQIKLWCLLRHNLILFDKDDHLLSGQLSDAELWWQMQHLDRAQIMNSLIYDLKSGKLNDVVAKKLAERIFVFGVSALPRVVVRFLEALSQYCSVNVMLMEPCQEYWGDIFAANNQDFLSYVKLIKATTRPLPKKHQRLAQKVIALPSQAFQRDYKYSDYDQLTGERVAGNPLLLSLGQLGRDNLRLFFELDPVPNNITCFSEPDLGSATAPFTSSVRTVGDEQGLQREQVEVHGGSLLTYIQRQLLSLEQPHERYFIAPSDQSLQVHVCHTKRREVEVLHDAIKACFNQAKLNGEELYPRDIVVMVPAINEYAPYISAVFGGSYSEDDPDYIPFVISDMTEDQSNTVAQSLLNLLDISSHLLTATTVIDLLSDESISRHFGLYHNDVAVLATWLNENHVYWGLDATDVESIAAIDIPGTFAKGMDRMLLGSLLGDSQQLPCFSEIQGLDTQILGKFWDFLRALRELRQHFTPELSLTPEGWANELQKKLIQRFFATDEKTQRSLQAVNQVIEELKVTIHHLYYQPKINLPVFVAALRQGLVARRNFQPFLREKINFCSLMPMRAVPFTHIFILGLNDSDFPREERTLGFNFMSARDLFECGDRSNNIDDRFLFLEAIMSARQSIYFSYIGRDPQNNSELNPSVVLNELLFYLSDQCALEGESTLNDGERQQHVLDRLQVMEHLNAYQRENFAITREFNEQANKEIKDALAAKAAKATKDVQTTVQPPRLPSFNHNFVLPDQDSRQDPAILGAGIFFEDMSPYADQVLDLQDLMSFVKKPSRYFLRKLLKVNFNLEEENPLQGQDEAFSMENFAVNNLVGELLREKEAERWSYLERQAQLGRLPYGIFKQELLHQLMEHLAPLATAVKQHLQVESLSEMQEPSAAQKRTFTIVLPVAYFTTTQEGQEPIALANMDDLVALNVAYQQHEQQAGTSRGGAGGESRVQLEFQGQLQDCYRFRITLQADYREQPFVLSTFSTVKDMGKKQAYQSLVSTEEAYSEAFTRSSLVFDAVSAVLAYYLQYGAGHEVPIIDAAGAAYKLAKLDSEQLRYILTALLIFYVLGLSAPVPCCAALLRCGSLSEDGDLQIEEKNNDVYVNFAYDDDSAYLYGTLKSFAQEPRLAAVAKVFLDFYVRRIAPYFVKADQAE